MAGRPSDYTPEIAAMICDRIASGESLRKICRDDAAPDQTTVYRWLREREDFRQQYAGAREAQGESYADEIVDIADEPISENVTVDHKRVRIDARKWAASKLAPKKYGDRTQLEHTGRDGGPIQVAKVEWAVVDPSADDSTGV